MSTPKPKYCGSCGKLQVPNAKFCPNCGSKQVVSKPLALKDAAQIAAQIATQPAAQKSPQTNPLPPAQPPSDLRAQYNTMNTKPMPRNERIHDGQGPDQFVIKKTLQQTEAYRSYKALSPDNKLEVTLYETLSPSELNSTTELAKSMSTGAQLAHVARLLPPLVMKWVDETVRYFVAELIPPTELSLPKQEEQSTKSWQVWAHQLALGLSALHQRGVAFGFSAPGEMLAHISILSEGTAQWKRLGDVLAIVHHPDAPFKDVRAFAQAMLIKIPEAPNAVLQLLQRAAQPGSKVAADEVARAFGPAVPTSTVVQTARTAPIPTHMELGRASNKGMVREGNEDNLLAMEIALGNDAALMKPALLAVADGMGGEDAGEIASEMTLKLLLQSAMRHISKTPQPAPNEWIQQTVKDINDAVLAEASKRNNAMGSTLVFALVDNGVANVGNVGDSRIYLWNPKRNNGQLQRLTRDHSLVEQLVQAGSMTDDERYTHPDRNMILRSIGDRQHCASDNNNPVEIMPGDWLLLCSDGLWEMVRDAQIREILMSSSTPQAACSRLIDTANLNGGEDNVTAVIARFS